RWITGRPVGSLVIRAQSFPVNGDAALGGEPVVVREPLDRELVARHGAVAAFSQLPGDRISVGSFVAHDLPAEELGSLLEHRQDRAPDIRFEGRPLLRPQLHLVERAGDLTAGGQAAARRTTLAHAVVGLLLRKGRVVAARPERPPDLRIGIQAVALAVGICRPPGVTYLQLET